MTINISETLKLWTKLYSKNVFNNIFQSFAHSACILAELADKLLDVTEVTKQGSIN